MDTILQNWLKDICFNGGIISVFVGSQSPNFLGSEVNHPTMVRSPSPGDSDIPRNTDYIYQLTYWKTYKQTIKLFNWF